MRHRTQFLPSRTFPPLPGSIGLGPSLSFQLSSCYHPRPLTPRFPCEGTCNTAFPVLRASAATLLTKLHATHQPPPHPAPPSLHPVHLFSLTRRSFTHPVPNPPTLALLLHLSPTPHIFWNPAQVYQEMQLPSRLSLTFPSGLLSCSSVLEEKLSLFCHPVAFPQCLTFCL